MSLSQSVAASLPPDARQKLAIVMLAKTKYAPTLLVVLLVGYQRVTHPTDRVFASRTVLFTPSPFPQQQ